jgi:hypothetical protein
MSVLVTVQLDAVDALAEELALLADELLAEAPRCRTAAAELDGALGDLAGWDAGAAATAWAALLEVLAGDCASTAATLRAAVAAYRAEDAALAAALLPAVMRPGRVGAAAVPR